MSKNLTNYGNLPATGHIRQRQVLEVVPFSPATLWRKVKTKEFPAPVKLSARITAWEVSSIRDWLESKAQKEAGI